MKTSILSGEYKGQSLVLPPNSITRAVSEKVRAAIFNTLGDIKGLMVLDLYAGGGTLGFEALSQGAATVVFVDKSKKSVEVIGKNTAELGLREGVTILNQTVEKAIENPWKFDLVFFDPPYAEFDIGIVEQLADLVELGGIIVLSSSSKTEFDIPTDFELIKSKTYGDTKITYLRKL